MLAPLLARAFCFQQVQLRVPPPLEKLACLPAAPITSAGRPLAPVPSTIRSFPLSWELPRGQDRALIYPLKAWQVVDASWTLGK